MSKTVRITCHYRELKKGLPDWVVLCFISLTPFTLWLLLLSTNVENINILLILSLIGFSGNLLHFLTIYLFSIYSPIKCLKWKKLLQVFSEYASLLSENKPTRWEVSSSNDKHIIKFMPTGSIKKTMAHIEDDMPEKLTQFLEVKTKMIWRNTETIAERSSITMIFTHNELIRKEVIFDV